MPYWTVPPMFEGKTVAVLASGPSMSQEVADRVGHLPRIAVNTTYKLARDADVIYACDRSWWARHPDALECPGLKVAMEPLPGKLPLPSFPDKVLTLRNTGQNGYDNNPACLRTLNNSGGQALQVAIHARAARIILLGFDMRGRHWHPEEEGSNFNVTADYHDEWIMRFQKFAMAIMESGLSIVNCTPGSALKCFPRWSLDDALFVASLGVAA